MSRSSAERGSNQGAMGRVREVDYSGCAWILLCVCVVWFPCVNPCNVCVIATRLAFDGLTVPLLRANFRPQPLNQGQSQSEHNIAVQNSLVDVQSGVGNG